MIDDQRAHIAIIGTYPPPYGGVATHVQRLLPLLERAGVSCVIYNAAGTTQDPPAIVSVSRHRALWMLRYALTGREPVVYVLSDRVSAWLAGAFMAVFRGKRVIIRLRNSALPDILEKGSFVQRALACWALKRMTAVVAVSEALGTSAGKAGVAKDRVLHFPGFLPPLSDAGDRQGIAEEVWSFIDSRTPVIAGNGKIASYAGKDLYGLDLLVELAARLKPNYPDVGIVVCFWKHEPEEDAHLKHLEARAVELGVADNILFNTKSGPFVPVLNAADVFVRPTNTDGDANSIREALFLGMPAVASDVVVRPQGTILFRTRDLNDLSTKVRAALDVGGKETGGLESSELAVRSSAYVGFLASVASGTWRCGTPR